MNFRQALTQVYLENPCRVLPNALWKTLDRLEGYDTSFSCGPGKRVNHLEIWHGARLLLFWDRDSQVNVLQERVDALSFALLHDDYLNSINIQQFARCIAYFRLAFRGRPPQVLLPEGFHFKETSFIDPAAAAVQAANFISHCYQDLHPSAQSALEWTRQPVFQPDLWLWIWDEARNNPAAMGIAEIDTQVGEGSLEWIQVLPEYRGQGLGQALVSMLLRRMHKRCAFVTVSGQADSPSSPERLYRRCGFSGNDLWWVLS